MTDEILTLPEVATLLKVADKTVYTMAQRGRLPAFKVGGQWRFKRVDLDQWIEEGKRGARSQSARPRKKQRGSSAPAKQSKKKSTRK